MAYTMGFNLFLTGAEVFKEFYSGTEHLVYTQYLWFGIEAATTPWCPSPGPPSAAGWRPSCCS